MYFIRRFVYRRDNNLLLNKNNRLYTTANKQKGEHPIVVSDHLNGKISKSNLTHSPSTYGKSNLICGEDDDGRAVYLYHGIENISVKKALRLLKNGDPSFKINDEIFNTAMGIITRVQKSKHVNDKLESVAVF